MSRHAFDPEDIEALATILESERKHHCYKRSVCFGLFVFWLILLVIALVSVAWITIGAHYNLLDGPLIWLQGLTALSAAVVSFFSMWWTVQNCIHSIERTLFAARAGREQLFISFLQEVQCASKEKRRVWLELAKDIVA